MFSALRRNDIPIPLFFFLFSFDSGFQLNNKPVEERPVRRLWAVGCHSVNLLFLLPGANQR